MQTGSVTSVTLTAQASSLVWDPVTGRLLSTFGAPGPLQVLSIDPDTGVVQTLFTAAIPFSESRFTFDAAGRRLFVLSDNNNGFQKLNTINLTNGNITTVSVASVTTTYFGMRYDPVTNRLIVLGATNTGTELLSIDPATGSTQVLWTAGSPIIALADGMTFEPVSRTAIIFDGQTNELVFVNIDTGNVSISAPLPGIAGQTEPYGLFAVAPVATDAPTLSTIALILLAILLVPIALRQLSGS